MKVVVFVCLICSAKAKESLKVIQVGRFEWTPMQNRKLMTTKTWVPKKHMLVLGGAKQPRQHCSQFSKDVIRTLMFFFYICIYSLWKV